MHINCESKPAIFTVHLNVVGLCAIAYIAHMSVHLTHKLCQSFYHQTVLSFYHLAARQSSFLISSTMLIPLQL